MNRYSVINEKFPREFVLLQGTGCKWRKCSFCDYYKDVSADPYTVNAEVLSSVTGVHGVLDIINSGSCCELDDNTLSLIENIVYKHNIHTLWFEAHWIYRELLSGFSARFPGVNIKYRTGVETFDPEMRLDWNKGIPAQVTAMDIAAYFNGICLLIGVSGQSRDMISRDINTALANFEYFSVNVFVENSTEVKTDKDLVNWFIKEWKEKLSRVSNAEVLFNNTDLGVG